MTMETMTKETDLQAAHRRRRQLAEQATFNLAILRALKVERPEEVVDATLTIDAERMPILRLTRVVMQAAMPEALTLATEEATLIPLLRPSDGGPRT